MSSEPVYLSEVEHVLIIKKGITLRDSVLHEEYIRIIKEAEALLSAGPFSVTQKTKVPPSGNKKDYLSLGPYWWPDPSKPNGLPWIRKDGEVNPKTRDSSTDIRIKNTFFKVFKKVAWAAILSEDKKFIRKSEELLHTWFTDPDTGMNPNLKYAQGIPGLNEGRGFGIIEFAGFADILMYVELMEYFQLLNEKLITEFNQWTRTYSDWLQHSELGIFESITKNNHGTWYDVQRVAILLFLNETDEAKKLLVNTKENRIAAQIKPDGSQPHELKRTKALSYSTMNLKAFTKLAYFAKKNDIDLWNYSAPNGASIPKAYEFLFPYVSTNNNWEYKQIKDRKAAMKKLQFLIKRSGCIFNVPKYKGIPVELGKIERIFNSCN